MTTEEWRPVVGYEGTYEVSDAGRIRRVGGHLVGQWLSDQGYSRARLSRPRCIMPVHRAVATAFVPNPRDLPSVNHLNNDRSDNRAGNLEWCTQAENLAHADRQGRMQKDYWAGKRTPVASLSDAQVRAIRELYAGGHGSYAALAQRFGVSKRTVDRCVNLRTYADV